MNLRNEKGFILSKPAAKDHTFVNIVEPHGANNPIAEFTVGFMPVVKNLALVSDDASATTISFDYNGKKYTVTLNYYNKQSFISIK
jgi:oligo-alginate lyase